ncbi:uncharacterized protein B0J16DRAFT_364901 [Fusarium flagelliforme]|uniref:uncharacterized protein n=1 Tax=Fusarium flagelliforme TaxID=2675880 RepID=UPI001E8E0CB2|nr:uncharacterized protein B0J16DRAFT_364901 [Fusarium flagelliforme]KAH7174908.1 hypothetical protein B0J16DRAFT_364901 [Fusarium flagelliforme]
MHFSAAILALAATVSAVDLRSYTSTGCTGGWTGCLGINPGVCCVFSEGAGSGKLSVSVNAIPREWRIMGEAYTGGGCRYIANQQNSNGNTDICLSYGSRGDRTGGIYKFVGRKRAADESCPAEQPNGEKCESAVKADSVGLADGTIYNISSLADEKVEELVKIADSGAGADEVPAEFHSLRR